LKKAEKNSFRMSFLAYNPLIPNGKELNSYTLMFEIDNPISRAAFLRQRSGVLKKEFI
jgi:hypothetical protein